MKIKSRTITILLGFTLIATLMGCSVADDQPEEASQLQEHASTNENTDNTDEAHSNEATIDVQPGERPDDEGE